MKKVFLLSVFALSSVFALGVYAADGVDTIIEIDEDEQVVILDTTHSGNDSDVISNPMVEEDADGTVTVIDDYVVFTPAEGFDGEATITYERCDETGCEEEVVVITESNMSGDSSDDDYLVVEDGSETVLDIPDSNTTIEITDQPENGELELVDGELVYTADDDFEGVDVVVYDVCEEGSCETVTVYVKIISYGRSSSIPATKKYRKGFPVCGDGVVQAFIKETCDDGNLSNKDGCSSTCKIEGDMITQIKKEIVKAPPVVKVPVVKRVKKVVDIDAIVMKHLNTSEQVLINAIDKYVSKKTTSKKIEMYEKVINKFPDWAYKKYGMNKKIIHIILKAKIDQLS